MTLEAYCKENKLIIMEWTRHKGQSQVYLYSKEKHIVTVVTVENNKIIKGECAK